jgi:hypothetical protein
MPFANALLLAAQARHAARTFEPDAPIADEVLQVLVVLPRPSFCIALSSEVCLTMVQ